MAKRLTMKNIILSRGIALNIFRKVAMVVQFRVSWLLQSRVKWLICFFNLAV